MHQAVVKHRAVAHVGHLLAGELVDIGAVQPELAPPDAQAIDHTRAGTFRHLRLSAVFATLVKNPHHLAALDTARSGIVGVDFQQRLAFNIAQAFHIDEAGVEEVARGR